MAIQKCSRGERLMPGGVPRYVRCYDNNGETWDRYTIVFTGRYRGQTVGDCMYIGASERPFDPQGFGQHGSSPHQIDRPSYGHLGRKVAFSDLPIDVQRMALSTYRDLWNLPT